MSKEVDLKGLIGKLEEHQHFEIEKLRDKVRTREDLLKVHRLKYKGDLVRITVTQEEFSELL